MTVTLTITSVGTAPPETSEHDDTAAAFAALRDYANSRGLRVNELATKGGSLSYPADTRRANGVHQATATWAYER